MPSNGFKLLSHQNLRKLFAKTLCGPNLALDAILGNLGKKIVAIDYHLFVSDLVVGSDLEVSIKVLKKQLDVLQDMFTFLSVNNLSCLKDGALNLRRPGVLITVDDADISLLDALPEFERRGIPIAVFAPVGLCLDRNTRDGVISRLLCAHEELSRARGFQAGLLEKAEFFSQLACMSISELEQKLRSFTSELSQLAINSLLDRRFLGLAELSSLAAKDYVTVGSHTMSHPVLSTLPDCWLDWEISESSKYIAKINGDLSVFAYPFGFRGSFDERVETKLSQNSIEFSFTTRSRSIKETSHHLRLGRSQMCSFSDRGYVIGTASGVFKYWDTILRR